MSRLSIDEVVSITLQRPKGVSGNLLHKQIIEGFWEQFGGRKTNGHGFAPSAKMDALARISRIIIPYHKQKPIRNRREEFNDEKSSIHPFRRFGSCFVCQNQAQARHHIIQLQNGGINSRKNVVSLCDSCHAEIHPWLSK